MKKAPKNEIPTTPESYVNFGLGPLPHDSHATELYVDMVKRTVANIIYEDTAALTKHFDLRARVFGTDWPDQAHTMVGIVRLNNLQFCIEDAIKEGVAGDIIETGVFRGGSMIFARAVLKAHGVIDRRVILCDVFVDGPPLPFWKAFLVEKLASTPIRPWQRWFYFQTRKRNRYKCFPDQRVPDEHFVNFGMGVLQNLTGLRKRKPAPLESVKSNFARYGLLDEQVVFFKGFFAETLRDAPIEKLAVLRLDGDSYESTIDSLEPLYPKLSAGGYCIVDDYGSFQGCKRAVDEYRERHGISEELISIDDDGVFWKKTGQRLAMHRQGAREQ